MADSTIDLRIEPARPGDEVFLPPAQRLVLPLTPEELISQPREEPAPDIFFQLEPAERTTPTLPAALKRQLVINVETTGVLPWESRILSIAYKDAAVPDMIPVAITGEDEEVLLRTFLDVVKLMQPDELIGYFISFDYRFILAKCMLYRLPAAEMLAAELRDVGQIMQQIKEAFVFGLNKPGTLDNWSRHLLGVGKLGTAEDVFAAWERKDLAYISQYNAVNVELTFGLWTLIRLVSDFPIGIFLEFQTSQGAGTEGASQPGSALAEIVARNERSGTKTIREKETLAEFTVPMDSTEYTSTLTGKLLKFPK